MKLTHGGIGESSVMRFHSSTQTDTRAGGLELGQHRLEKTRGKVFGRTHTKITVACVLINASHSPESFCKFPSAFVFSECTLWVHQMIKAKVVIVCRNQVSSRHNEASELPTFPSPQSSPKIPPRIFPAAFKIIQCTETSWWGFSVILGDIHAQIGSVILLIPKNLIASASVSRS